jgi:iron(II)-dependent oxidoreductase
MPVIDDFTETPDGSADGSEEFAAEQDLLAMPSLPWTAMTATFFAVVMGFCIAHAVLLAVKETDKLVSKTLELRGNLKQQGVALAAIPNEDDVVLIPAGSFWMGREEGDESTNTDSTPIHQRYLPAYYIGKYEVTNAEYQAFVQAKKYLPPPNWRGLQTHPEGAAHLPVAYISSVQAIDYAAWRGGRLCTEPEWEKAARGSEDQRIHPYGDEYDPKLSNIDYIEERLMPVGSYPEGVSPYGVHDMMGNVYEWTADHYSPYPGNQDDPGQYAAYITDETGNVVIDPDQESYYIVTRGGCWKCDPWSSQVTTRNPTRPDFASDFFGMRVCWDAAAP